MIQEKDLTKILVKLIQKAETSLPRDVEEKLKEAYEKEKNSLAKIQLREILENIKFARKNSLPICQDTGLISFYVKIDEEVGVKVSTIKNSLQKAVKISTEKIPLRSNVVNPLTRENTQNNIGFRVPNINITFSKKKDFLEIIAFPKGAGSENMSSFKNLNPTEGERGIKKFILKKVGESKGNPCPPIILGIGIGGSSEQAMGLAKKALLRPLGKKNKNKEIRKLEEEILKEVNKLGIGVMGLGGSTTCLSVNIETAGTHTASLPIAINFGCWATRRASVKIFANGKVKFSQ
jgi:fumarate hydratase subunit alpha